MSSVKSHCSKIGVELFPRLAQGILLSVLLAACSREDVKVYSVPKETAGAAAGMPAGHPPTSAEFPKIKHATPDGWTATPGGAMRVASFGINKDGKTADVSVIPLPGSAGGDSANVNRWRGQIGLGQLAPEALKQTAAAVAVGAAPAELYDLVGTNSAGDPARILGVILPRDGTAWFFKMTGDEAVVTSQKPAFIEFLKSVEFVAGGTPPAGLDAGATMPPSHPPVGGPALPAGHPAIANETNAGPVAREGQPTWTVPAPWKEVSGGEFLVAKFLITGDGKAQAAVNVSRSAGDGGGLAGNVNRWRGQLGLTPLGADEAAKAGQTIKVNAGEATLVELVGKDGRTGQPAKLIGAILAQSGQSWFYKLMGEPKLVDANRDAFTQFVTDAKY